MLKRNQKITSIRLIFVIKFIYDMYIQDIHEGVRNEKIF